MPVTAQLYVDKLIEIHEKINIILQFENNMPIINQQHTKNKNVEALNDTINNSYLVDNKEMYILKTENSYFKK